MLCKVSINMLMIHQKYNMQSLHIYESLCLIFWKKSPCVFTLSNHLFAVKSVLSTKVYINFTYHLYIIFKFCWHCKIFYPTQVLIFSHLFIPVICIPQPDNLPITFLEILLYPIYVTLDEEEHVWFDLWIYNVPFCVHPLYSWFWYVVLSMPRSNMNMIDHHYLSLVLCNFDDSR